MTTQYGPDDTYVEPTDDETVDVTNLSNVDLDDLIEMIEAALDKVEEDLDYTVETLDNLKDMM